MKFNWTTNIWFLCSCSHLDSIILFTITPEVLCDRTSNIKLRSLSDFDLEYHNIILLYSLYTQNTLTSHLPLQLMHPSDLSHPPHQNTLYTHPWHPISSAQFPLCVPLHVHPQSLYTSYTNFTNTPYASHIPTPRHPAHQCTSNIPAPNILFETQTPLPHTFPTQSISYTLHTSQTTGRISGQFIVTFSYAGPPWQIPSYKANTPFSMQTTHIYMLPCINN